MHTVAGRNDDKCEDRKSAPLVSVIITSYNHARFLPEAIESVLEQSFQDFEIVLIDDGSTDDTAAVAGRYEPVRYLRQTNQGLAAARNTGIRQSSGPFLLFLDADDKLRPRALEASLYCFRNHADCGFVSGLFRRITPAGISAAQQPVVNSEHYLGLLKGNYIGMHATVMYRREVIEDMGGFDCTLPACEDYDLYLRIARSYPVARHDEVVADYRWHDTNMSYNAAMMLSCTLQVLRRQRQHLRGDPERRAALKQGLRFWQRYYGRIIARQVKAGGPGMSARRRAQGAMALLRFAPRTLLLASTKRIARLLLSERVIRRVRSAGSHATSVGKVNFGELNQLFSGSNSGAKMTDRIDRFYIAEFLLQHRSDIRAPVLVVGDDSHTRNFADPEANSGDLLNEKQYRVTFETELANLARFSTGSFQCVILPHSLQRSYDVGSVLATLKRILRPEGVLLATVPGTINRRTSADECCWGFTNLSLRKLFHGVFPPEQLSVQAYGNVLSCTAYLAQLPATELTSAELLAHDPLYPLVIGVCRK